MDHKICNYKLLIYPPILMAFLGTLFGFFMHYISPSGWFSTEDIVLSLIVGTIGGIIISIAFFIGEHLRRRPTSIRLTTEALIVYFDEKEMKISWDDIEYSAKAKLTLADEYKVVYHPTKKTQKTFFLDKEMGQAIWKIYKKRKNKSEVNKLIDRYKQREDFKFSS